MLAPSPLPSSWRRENPASVFHVLPCEGFQFSQLQNSSCCLLDSKAPPPLLSLLWSTGSPSPSALVGGIIKKFSPVLQLFIYLSSHSWSFTFNSEVNFSTCFFSPATAPRLRFFFFTVSSWKQFSICLFLLSLPSLVCCRVALEFVFVCVYYRRRLVLQCWQAEIGVVGKRFINSSRERARAKWNVKLKHMLHSEWAVCAAKLSIPLSLSLTVCAAPSLCSITSKLPLFAFTWSEVPRKARLTFARQVCEHWLHLLH